VSTRDFALVWQEEGLEAVRKVARKSPENAGRKAHVSGYGRFGFT